MLLQCPSEKPAIVLNQKTLMSNQLPCGVQACPELTVPNRSSSGVPLDHQRALGNAPTDLPPQQLPHLLFETSSKLRQKGQTIPQKQALPAPLLANSGKHHMTSLSLRLSFTHSLTTYWQKFLLTRCHQIFFFSVYSLPNLKFASIILSKTSIAIQYRS